MSNTGIIYVDDYRDDNITDALFGRPLQATQDYITRTVHNYTQAVGAVSSTLASEIQNRFNEIRSSKTIHSIDILRNKLNSAWLTDTIRKLSTLSAIQNAAPIMQRWIMACPPLRERFNHGNISAYDKSYIDIHPGGVAETHYDYRRVTDSVYMETEKGKFTCTQYYENLDKPEDLLTIINKYSIIATWDVINKSIESEDNIDPTSIWNGTL